MDDFLTIKEVAVRLKLAEKTVYSMANAGEIPAFKIRGQWRLRRVDLDQWLSTPAKAPLIAPQKGNRRRGRRTRA